MQDAKLHDEAARLAALERYQILDTAREGPFDKITGLVRTVLGVDSSVVSFVDDRRQWFKSVAGLDATETPRCVAFCAHTIAQRTPLIVEDAREDARFAANPLVTGDPHIRSYLGIPLATPDGYNLGSLCAIDGKPRSFSAREIKLMESFAALLLDELELRTIAHLDHLTGAAMRRPWLDNARREYDRARRYDRPVSIIALDLDRFKRINDSFGHAAGDEVLKAVAATCQTLLRPSDSFCRLGGEEFGLLLPETGEHEAMAAAERLRRAVAALPPFASGPSSVTASFGVAALHAAARDIDGLLAEADAALYRAKHRGRNCCVSASDTARAAA